MPVPSSTTTSSILSVSTSDYIPLENSFNSSSDPLPSVSFINAAAYAHAAHLPRSTVFTVTLSASDSKAEPVDLSGIPEEYHKLQDVFSKAKAGNLALHHPYNLKIDLKEGAQLPLRRMYPLLEKELDALQLFLDENLRTNFIHSSSSAHGAPILFIKKKDGSLHLCVDYQGLNKISKKDQYSLLLQIADLLDTPGKAQIYTKIDLRHTYHLI